MERSYAANGFESIVSLRFSVSEWIACGVGLGRANEQVAWVRSSASVDTDTRSQMTLPPLLRRRVTALGQMTFKAALELSALKRARFIFSSRHGEFKRTLSILTALAAAEPVSPAEFSLSVHNALAGLLSIARHNNAGHTAIAAGANSFQAGLIEAAACLIDQPDQPVLLVYFDDALPAPCDELVESVDTCLALALLLTSPQDKSQSIVLELMPRKVVTVAPPSASEQALAFVHFLNSPTSEGFDGEHLRWRSRA
jgi:Beta-ketoacyl synthase, N-terminal domain